MTSSSGIPVGIEVKVELGADMFVCVSGRPALDVSIPPEGANITVTIKETGVDLRTGISKDNEATNVVAFRETEGVRMARMALTIECFAAQYKQASSGSMLNMEGAVSAALKATPSAVSKVISNVQQGAAWSPDPYPLLPCEATAAWCPVDVPIYHPDFLGAFRGTSLHATIELHGFVTRETNDLRVLQRKCKVPRDILAHCHQLRQRCIAFKSEKILSPHNHSAIQRFEHLEIGRAERIATESLLPGDATTLQASQDLVRHYLSAPVYPSKDGPRDDTTAREI